MDVLDPAKTAIAAVAKPPHASLRKVEVRPVPCLFSPELRARASTRCPWTATGLSRWMRSARLKWVMMVMARFPPQFFLPRFRWAEPFCRCQATKDSREAASFAEKIPKAGRCLSLATGGTTGSRFSILTVMGTPKLWDARSGQRAVFEGEPCSR